MLGPTALFGELLLTQGNFFPVQKPPSEMSAGDVLVSIIRHISDRWLVGY